MVETKTETETRILTIFEKETARDRPLDVETEVETKISGWYASVTYNKHGYAISSRYSCKYTVCKLSSSSHLPIPLLILHQSLYFVLRLGYILLLLLHIHQISHIRMGYVRIIHHKMHVIVKKFFGPTDRPTDKVSYRNSFPELKLFFHFIRFPSNRDFSIHTK